MAEILRTWEPSYPDRAEQTIDKWAFEELSTLAEYLPYSPNVNAASAQLLDNTFYLNRQVKFAGLQIWNSTLLRPMWATGPLPGDAWVTAEGSTSLVPVTPP